MGEEVNKVIENICSKLGTTAQFLIPELAKKNIVEDAMSAIFAAIVMAAIIYLIKKICQMCDGFDSDTVLIITFPAFFFFVAFTFFAAMVCDLAGWIASPTAKAVQEIANMVR